MATSSLVRTADVEYLFSRYLAPAVLYIPELNSELPAKIRLKELWTEGKRSSHPLLHILFHSFIDDLTGRCSDGSNDGRDFGTGPWPCLNRLSTHYGEQRIAKLILHDFGPDRAIKAAFRCPDCNYTYRRTKGTDIVDAMNLGDEFDERLAKLIADNATPREIELALHVGEQRIRSAVLRLGLSMPSRDTAFHKTLREAKAEFEQLLARYPGASRTELGERNQRLYKRLQNQCPQWLHARLPPPKPSGNGRDWRRSDNELAVAVAQRAETRRSSVPPKKITRSYLLGPNGWQARAAQNKIKLPRSWALIEELTESLDDYYERALTWAASDLLDRGMTPSKTSMRRLIGAAPRANPIAERVIQNISTQILGERKLTCPNHENDFHENLP